jgi:hypothetical protein
MRLSPTLVSALALLCLPLLRAAAAYAQEPAQPPPAPLHEDDEERETPPIPAASDLLGGHPLLGVAGKLAVPFGELDTDRSFGGQVGLGYGVAGDLGIGLSRSVELGVWGDYVLYADDEDCRDCEVTSYGVGPYLRYHLVQGMRFDPFVSVGLGYRGLTISSDAGDSSEGSLAWLKLGLGGTWYALSQIGFGPYLDLELATLTDTPPGADPSVFANFGAGLRLQFDVRGR